MQKEANRNGRRDEREGIRLIGSEISAAAGIPEAERPGSLCLVSKAACKAFTHIFLVSAARAIAFMPRVCSHFQLLRNDRVYRR